MKKINLLIISIVLIAISCGPSIENEKKNWDKNLQEIEKLKTDYPGFATMLDESLQKAKTVWKESENISDQKEKASKISDANEILEKNCIGNLRELKSKLSVIDSKIEEVKKLRSGEKGEEKRYAEDAITDAESAISFTEGMLNDAKNGNSDSPCEKIEKSYKKLDSAFSNLGVAISKLNSKKNQQIDTSKNKNNTNNTNTIVKPEPVKCSYCGTLNEADYSKCKSCGAPK